MCLVGNKEGVAIEVNISDVKTCLGKLFVYIGGKKFGYENHDYDIETALKNIIQYFTTSNADYKNLAASPPQIIFSAFDKALNSLSGYNADEIVLGSEYTNDPINSYYQDFYLDFMSSSILDDCIFRLGTYLMDNTLLIIIPISNSLKLYARSEYNHAVFSEILVKSSDFHNLWKKALDCLG